MTQFERENPAVNGKQFDPEHAAQTLRALNAALDSTAAISSSDDLDACILAVLAKLGDGIDADRAYLFKDIRVAGGVHITSQIAEWTREGVSKQMANPKLQEIPVPQRWMEAFLRGGAISGLVTDFPESERAVLASQQIQSLLVVPIYNENSFWGFMGFDAVLTPRKWSKTEESLLRIASLTLGMNFARMIFEKEHAAWEKKNRQIQLLHEAGLEHMAGSIAHIFNNQLCVILGTLDLLEGEFPSDSPCAESIQLALKATRHCAKISDTMLIYLGQTHDKTSRADLVLLCKNLLEAFGKELPSCVNMTFASSADSLFADVNEVHFQEVLRNILVNAKEAMPKGGKIAVAVKGSPKEAFIASASLSPSTWLPTSASYVSLTVEDSGIGICESDLLRIFDPFFTTKFQGRGLGLSLVAGYMKSWNGAVSIVSEVGKGTKVTLYLSIQEAI